MLDSVTLKLKTGIKQCPSHSFRGAINLNKTNNPKPLSPKITDLYIVYYYYINNNLYLV